ncbi:MULTISPECIES: TetR/AcrR family transcriptional regulator C-terminal domain-containing protein [Amycolatopsis]|uniref:Regulatory protein, tetR family n=2 Tax=Amycolatopsis TaxID=1813 RepID=A0A1I3M9Y5_9PSEU|nr:TetR/AcrR family transcriptional regulator C-terminal domain-containing protein [Amycolatopsis sacchari]SFI93516.1 regulatory protein, tetR family [Amycolatopsis sacchari]
MANSAAVPGRPRSRDAAGLPAVTPDGIIAAALDLAASQGLESWTLRQLAGAVQAYPAVIYHHVGDREAVVSAVVDRVVGMVAVPPEGLPWREWFAALATEMRAVLTRFPGVARRIAVHGLSPEAAGPSIDRGVRILQQGGFGDESAQVYRFLANIICHFISVEDEHRRNSEDYARDAARWTRHVDDQSRPGLATMSAWLHTLVTNPEQHADHNLFDYAIERCLDGVEARLAVIRRR